MVNYLRLTYGIASFLVALPPMLGYKPFQNRIPNGDSIPHPCIENETWAGVGHEYYLGRGALNPFGKDFKEIGNFQWTLRLCEMDSDDDGYTNGQELGDPDCIWKENDKPTRTTNITHPGICTPYGSPECLGREDFITCEPPPAFESEFECENVRRSEVIGINYNFPKTKVPAKETTYVCYTFNATSPEDYFLIGMEPIVDNKRILHHIVAYGCPETTELTKEPVNCIMGASCEDMIGVWAPGMAGICLPDDIGFLFGPTGYKRIQLEFHWNNEDTLDGLYDASGMRMYFERRRPNMIEAGILLVGQLLIEIPGAHRRVEVTGTCPGNCSSQLWSGSLNFFAGINHMHYIGSSQRTTLWNGSHTIDLANDKHASFDLPIYHTYDPPIRANPGDTIQTTCFYDSSNRYRTTYYGPGSSDEMCFFFGFYYPTNNNTVTPYCLQRGPLNQCQRIAKQPYGQCDWASFVDEAMEQSSDVAQDLQRKCLINGRCQPECQPVVDVLKEHPCLQRDTAPFVTQYLEHNLEGVKFLARYSSCRQGDVCPTFVPPTDYPASGSKLSPKHSFAYMLLVFVAVLFRALPI